MVNIRALAAIGALVLAASDLTYARAGQIDNELFRPDVRLAASDEFPGNLFGRVVAIDGDTSVIGASGAAYVFVRRASGAWEEVAKLVPSDAGASASFGGAVAISGDIVIVGAAGAEAAFVFSRDHGGMDAWGEVQKLVATGGTTGDGFGSSVAIDGDTAVIGAPRFDDAGEDAGTAYVFSRAASNPDAWTQAARLSLADKAARDSFGFSVSISGDTIVVGAPFKSSYGTAHVFTRDHGSGSWSETARLVAQASRSLFVSEFGRAVSVDGDVAAVGAPRTGAVFGSAHVFVRDHGGPGAWGEVWYSEGLVDCQMGRSVDVSGDTVVVVEGGFDLDCEMGVRIVVPHQGTDSWATRAWLRAQNLSPAAASIDDGQVIVGYGFHADEDDNELRAGFVQVLEQVPIASVPVVNQLLSATVESAGFGDLGFEIRARITNTSDISIRNPFVEVVELTGGNVVAVPFYEEFASWKDLPGGAGATLGMSDASLFAPGQTTVLTFRIGLASRRSFRFIVNVRGDPLP